jgi:branched-chain amino acid transport system ATP-binding protein
MSVLEARSLSRRFGGLQALSEVGFSVDAGVIHAIIGPNGAGKTTLLNLLSGHYQADAGEVLLNEADVTQAPIWRRAELGLGRSFQNLQIFSGMSVLENVLVGRHRHMVRDPVSALLRLPRLRRSEEANAVRAKEILEFVGLRERALAAAETLPYGALRRLEIARALAGEPCVLLLDEPAAGCNETESAQIAFLLRKIADLGIAVVLIEHDMNLVMRISDRILVLDRGRRLAEGPPSQIAADPKVIAAYLGEAA